MSREALSPQQFAPRTGDVHGEHVSAVVSQVKPGRYYLRNLAVKEEHRKKGIGTGFMKSLLKEHDVAGSSVTLHTRDALVPWYSSLGFESEGKDLIGNRMTRHPRQP